MKRCRVVLGAWLAALALGCQTPAPGPTPTPTPDVLAGLLQRARQAESSSDWETAALALREAVELQVGRADVSSLEQTRTACVNALAQAGGNLESHRLWSELERKNGVSEETTRMKERARKMMVMQGQELLQHAELDHQEGRPQAALCTARAALLLYQEAAAPAEELKAAEEQIARFERGLNQEEEQPSAAPLLSGPTPTPSSP